MQFNNSTASITSTLFTSNSIGSWQGVIRLRMTDPLAVGGALSISSSNVTVTSSTLILTETLQELVELYLQITVVTSSVTLLSEKILCIVNIVRAV